MINATSIQFAINFDTIEYKLQRFVAYSDLSFEK